MAIGLFKTGDQLYSLGLDAINRKDWKEARGCFQNCLRKESSQHAMARLMLACIDVAGDRRIPSRYQKVADAAEECGARSFRFGLCEVEVDDLLKECELSAEEIMATSLPDSEPDVKGTRMIAVAGRFAAEIGDRTLKLREMFDGKSIYTGVREANVLQAQAYELMGRGCATVEPKKAAEYMQMAATFRRMLGEDGAEDMELSRKYSAVGRCWLCGRQASGEGINFIAVRSTVNRSVVTEKDGDIIRSFAPSRAALYMCMPCYTALSNRADEISKAYYDEAMKEMRAMEARLQAEINSVYYSVGR